jgi:hypothetical protein
MSEIRGGKFIAITGAIVLAAGVATAAIPRSSTGEIAACYGKKGELRAIDAEAGEVCGTKETPLSWPTRPQFVVRTINYVTHQGYGDVATVFCAAGEVVTGGGYQMGSGIPVDRVPSVIGSHPDGATSWQVMWHWTPDGEEWLIYAICAKQ